MRANTYNSRVLIKAGVVRGKFADLTDEINHKLGTRLSLTDVALGFVRIANETMDRPIKEIGTNVKRWYPNA